MMRHAVVADDLTGANAVGILLKNEGLEAVTLIGCEPVELDVDSCVFSTNSRGMEKEEAYKLVYSLASRLKLDSPQLFSKRIDSTMRGNIGAEIDGLLDALGKLSIAVCTPAYPDSGRTVKHGELFVDGIPVTESTVAKDPKSKINTSSVKEIIAQQSKYPVGGLSEEEICGGSICLSGKMDDIISKGYRIIVCDAVTNQEIERIAQAIARNSHLIITADSGVLTAYTAGERIKPAARVSGKKVLAVIGSVNAAARIQLESLWERNPDAGRVVVHTAKLMNGEQRNLEMARASMEAAAVKGRCNIVTVVSDGIYPENRIELTEERSRLINRAFGGITRRILEQGDGFRGLYTSGGDITMAVYELLEAKGIRVLDEVLPLAVYGRLMGGLYPGLPVITKGGSQGDSKAIEKCVRYLFDQIQNN